ncbi:hypothetical protein JOF53_003188 [Crossiella equi]|uniref:Lantibiotic biosynthesis protein dehydration domain-containing protein n=1 Tax=Crossiella equi TaxID=130796 RepID=A0ABS5ACL7_9PSEU|nr:hypothetical protein [Crossiella equi]
MDKAAFLAERRPVGKFRDGSHSVAEWRESAYLDEETLGNRPASARLGSAKFAHLVSGGDFEAEPKSAEWVRELHAVLSAEQPVPELPGVIISLYGRDYDRVPFLGFTWPFLSAYGARLRSRADESWWRLPLTERAVVTALSDLATGLTEIAHRTLIIDLHEARTAGLLSGATPQARYTDYDERILAEPATSERILAEHPVLARELIRCAGQWLAHSTEVLDRLSADLPSLRAAGLLAGTSAVSALCPGLGDPHGNGRSVTKLEFEDGQALRDPWLRRSPAGCPRRSRRTRRGPPRPAPVRVPRGTAK